MNLKVLFPSENLLPVCLRFRVPRNMFSPPPVLLKIHPFLPSFSHEFIDPLQTVVVSPLRYLISRDFPIPSNLRVLIFHDRIVRCRQSTLKKTSYTFHPSGIYRFFRHTNPIKILLSYTFLNSNSPQQKTRFCPESDDISLFVGSPVLYHRYKSS